jgi:hypothetical protein
LFLVSLAIMIVFPGEGNENSVPTNLWALATLIPSLSIGAR